ncbi:hypothetical protein TVAG_206760 [Trichomonas vaginalis G3]|uniref:Uncharacterized protein n=1 Tax=Trichomonas vaginalis (strain ATCC PRA-98 / G3) TaxID=412133 RepID=A2EY54_TRIV3|nr:hypothetical protein TVAGG3_0413540 [Trichomonas vaginalis G3]EAY02400.1 hypothetical protein TVAG_206760 [Trichomonas vaginalis G3]KAI5535519.1 hypothetical protein TVAGG3_0413540 [Trichomonas vaginalis G3]|eukprot:XP_001330653.1 hypothetical protein [Trichomonas vaginalis G3]
MFLNVSLDGNAWITYWCEINSYYLDFYSVKENTEERELFSTIHLGFAEFIPSSNSSKPDVIEIIGTRPPMRNFRLYIYTYETFNLITLIKICKKQREQWISQPKYLRDCSISVKPHTILALRQKWNVNQGEVLIEKKTTEKIRFQLTDIEILDPIINPELPFHFRFRTRKMDDIAIHKLHSIDNMRDLFNTILTNLQSA